VDNGFFLRGEKSKVNVNSCDVLSWSVPKALRCGPCVRQGHHTVLPATYTRTFTP